LETFDKKLCLRELQINKEHDIPQVQWRALDDINAGICDGMTYEEIRIKFPEEYE
jgi:broad specificity phosphatase PhoE